MNRDLQVEGAKLLFEKYVKYLGILCEDEANNNGGLPLNFKKRQDFVRQLKEIFDKLNAITQEYPELLGIKNHDRN